ncbi:hypothetical protein FQN50_008835 [Emmonsiellopsis sp. PD_5]|nr:hypothetical protein FQN50_008835 [Emmonsiellopsis sp. PD_5]
MSTKPNDERARESFATIYSFYRNLDSADVPDWANDTESGNIIIGFVRHSAPTEEEMGKAKEHLRTLMALEGTKEKLTETEKKLFEAAADGATSTGDRYCSSSDEPTVEEGIAVDAKSLSQLSSSGRASQGYRKRIKEARIYREEMERGKSGG